MKYTVVLIAVFLTHFFSAQTGDYLGITGLSVSQSSENQLKVNLKVTGATYGEYLSYSTQTNQNTITLTVFYSMTGAGVITYFDNDFFIDITQ